MSSESTNRPSIEERDGGFVCLVDGDGEYNLSEENLKELITYVDPKGTQDYSIVGIMGCQSSGKSTLLNRLFDTKFQMMDSDRGRQQTTKGIWLDAARNTNNLVIMDLEGTDSGERGEDRTTFERQTILYGLALCEVLIVNMWEHDIGRYTASNYGVLKTVFEVNLQLFKQQGKTLLLFIVRDHIEQVTPFSKLKQKLLDEVQSIWAELRKPEEFEDASIFDFFDFRFEALPHKVLMSAAFEEEANMLKGKFIDPSHPEYLFDTPYHGDKSVPAEGFAKYSHGIWETIRSNQDLNLPSQKEMLATFRCDELSAQSLSKCLVEIGPIHKLSQERFVPDIGSRVGVVLSHCLESYDEGSAKYAEEVVHRKRGELLSKLMEHCSEILTDQLSRLVRSITRDFSLSLMNNLPQDAPTRAFYDIVARARAASLESFTQAKTDLFHGLPKDATISMTKTMQELDAAFDRCVAASRKDQFISLAASSLARFKELSEQQLLHFLRVAPSDMWPQIGALFNASFSSSTTYATPYLVALKANEHETATLFSTVLLESSEKFVHDLVVQNKAILPVKLRARFEEHFSKDEQGMRRRWTAKDDIRSLYLSSRDESLKLLPLFEKFQLRNYWGEEADEIAFSPAPVLPVPGSPGFSIPVSTRSKATPTSTIKSTTSSTTQSGDEEMKGEGEGEDESENEGRDEKHDDQDSQNARDSENEGKKKSVSSLAELSALPRKVPFKTKPGNSMATMKTMSVPGPSIILLTTEQMNELNRQFLLEIEGILSDAQREQERVTKATSLPPWAILVMLALGYNEITALLRSPIVLVLVVVLGFAALIVHSLGMWTPVQAMITNSLAHAYESFQAAIAPPQDEKLRGVVSNNEMRSHHNTNTTSSSTSNPTSISATTTGGIHRETGGLSRISEASFEETEKMSTTSSNTTTNVNASEVSQKTTSSGLPTSTRKPLNKSYATMPASSFAQAQAQKNQDSQDSGLRKRSPVEL